MCGCTGEGCGVSHNPGRNREFQNYQWDGVYPLDTRLWCLLTLLSLSSGTRAGRVFVECFHKVECSHKVLTMVEQTSLSPLKIWPVYHSPRCKADSEKSWCSL